MKDRTPSYPFDAPPELIAGAMTYNKCNKGMSLALSKLMRMNDVAEAPGERAGVSTACPGALHDLRT